MPVVASTISRNWPITSGTDLPQERSVRLDQVC